MTAFCFLASIMTMEYRHMSTGTSFPCPFVLSFIRSFLRSCPWSWTLSMLLGDGDGVAAVVMTIVQIVIAGISF